MKEIKSLFDDFNIHARIMPALISIIPIYIYLLLKQVINYNFMETLFSNSLIYILLVTLFYKVVRNLGKGYENRMYKELGGKPTTIVLRYSNDLIDEITKTRYHKKLNEKIKGIKMPEKKEKETEYDDVKYESAINWLRKYANSNRDKEPRVYQELKDYSFWRNLYGGKIIVIICCLLGIVIECVQLKAENIMDLIKSPFPKCTLLFAMIVILIISCIVIKKSTVKSKAFDYAKTLIEVCDSL